ncbi:glycosyltransferase family protein [Frigoriglobus tundricola]|uniref:Uncharacterized protein n=1 Tax=Frigoriglobus tundricola TaxID=2774151 RepID=A0A6M5Z3A2_9BACT|nr:glycosyltransferase family 39 protein [Frigoriglobus tundricola]QJX00729.1 hypothetical protein FTUN_8361 [Frigoriglobus tundricola]
MYRQILTHPITMAALVTLANAVKPVTVDDTAYIIYARHIAAHPTDPYGFPIFWWFAPEPAMGVLCPPVVPYWLAGGVALFGDSPALLKLWVFPFVWLLAWALRALVRRFARGTETFALPLLILSPAVLPTVNLMLDVPAAALAMAAVELFIRACRPRTSELPTGIDGRPNRLLAVAAGLVAGLAMQTKYSAFVAPAVIMWFGLTHRRAVTAVVAVCACGAVFAGWELCLVEKYGQSHFWFHATAPSDPPPGENKFSAALAEKFELIGFLAGHFGCLAVGAGLVAGSALRVPRRWLVGTAVIWSVGFVLVATLPRRWTVWDGDVTLTTAFWQASGALWFASVTACATALLLRVKRGVGFRLRPDTIFLIGWLAIEVAAALALTPFPAARRVIGTTLVAGLVAARAAGRIARARPGRRPSRGVLALGIAAGIAVAAIDVLDAFPEQVCAEMSADVTRDRPDTATVWYAGHWGFQHYCEREGMRPLVAGESVVRAGDYVVLPIHPDGGFHRPYTGFTVKEPLREGDEVAVIVWDDPLSAKTVPNFYGGVDPVAGRDHPRLRVRVYRLRADWAP